MLISITELKAMYPDFLQFNNKLLEMKLKAVEQAIRQYTNNTFQNRHIRLACYSTGKKLVSPTGAHLFKLNDTVQISVEHLNKGLYVVEEVGQDYIIVDREMYESMYNLVTKVEYPIDIIEGAINMLRWDMFDREKIGVASETISRHSVSYVQYDGSNTIGGYPISLFGFADLYKRART